MSIHSVGDTNIYQLNPVVAIEDFGDRSLILHCEDLRLAEINATARTLLGRLDGVTPLGRIAADLAALYEQSPDVVLADAQEVIAQMLELDIVQPASATDDTD